MEVNHTDTHKLKKKLYQINGIKLMDVQQKSLTIAQYLRYN